MAFEYKQPFDGTQPEIPESERQYVATTFASFVDDTILNRMDRITPSVGDEVMLPLTGEQNGQRIDVFVYNQPQAVSYTKAINLRHIDERGVSGDALSYRLGSDGIVRRVDTNKPTPDEVEADESSDLLMDSEEGVSSATAVDMLSKLLHQRKQILEGRENFRLETGMGVNNQPVGLAEIETVIEFVKTAKPKDK